MPSNEDFAIRDIALVKCEECNLGGLIGLRAIRTLGERPSKFYEVPTIYCCKCGKRVEVSIQENPYYNKKVVDAKPNLPEEAVKDDEQPVIRGRGRPKKVAV